MPEIYFSLLVKLGVMASIASIVARSSRFKSMLMREKRSLRQQAVFSFVLSIIFAVSVETRIQSSSYYAADLSLEGSLLAGILGGYVTGLLSGILIAIPSIFHGEAVALPLMAGVGVLGGLLRDLAPTPEEIWKFSPFPDLNLFRFFKESRNYRGTAFHLIFFVCILVAEFLRSQLSDASFPQRPFGLWGKFKDEHSLNFTLALYAATVFAVTIPLKIWNNARNERKLEEQERLLVEARLAALTSQINPHFLFNTLNSVSSLIRIDPDQARIMVVRLSKVLRRLLRKHEHFSALRDELSFIEDYLAIEVVRFGDKLRFEKDIAEDTLDMLVPSMLLQPLVENCIKHGLSNKVEGGTVRIRTRRSGARICVTVEDDGVGIPESKLDTLLDHGIGVSNVNERLKVLFAGEYRMWIDSQPGRGTRIEIEIPELHTALAAVS